MFYGYIVSVQTIHFGTRNAIFGCFICFRHCQRMDRLCHKDKEDYLFIDIFVVQIQFWLKLSITMSKCVNELTEDY